MVKLGKYFADFNFLGSRLTREIPRKLDEMKITQFRVFHYQSPGKYWTGPGSNSQPLDLQSDTLPTVLQGPVESLL